MAGELAGLRRVAVWATPSRATAVGVVAALLAGVPAIPLNPRSGPRELEHVVADVEPDAVLAAPGADLPEPLSTVPLLPSRGREVRFVAELPRNDLGKLVKARLPR